MNVLLPMFPDNSVSWPYPLALAMYLDHVGLYQYPLPISPTHAQVMQGWVQEMWGYSIAAASLGIVHTLVRNFQVLALCAYIHIHIQVVEPCSCIHIHMKVVEPCTCIHMYSSGSCQLPSSLLLTSHVSLLTSHVSRLTFHFSLFTSRFSLPTSHF